ncbi:Vacuolar protein sorting-associated protein 51 [Mortierella claussenii]|nr:Vacuolar protein sorting-associated protein 51 [Mortierella claussenii]
MPRKTSKKKSANVAGTGSGTGSAPGTLKEFKSKSSTPLSLPPTDKASYLNAHYLKQVEGFVVSFRNYYLVPAPGSGNNTGIVSNGGAGSGTATAMTPGEDSGSLDHRPPAWIAKDTRVFANLTSEQQDEASVAIKDAISKIVSQYLDIISSFLEYPEDISTAHPEVHVHVLQNLYLATLSSTGLCQLVGFDALATGLIQNWETQLIQRALNKVKVGLMTRIAQQDIDLAQRPKESATHDHLLDATTPEDSSVIASAGSKSNSPAHVGVPASGLDVVLKETTLWLQDIFKTDAIPFLEKCMSSDAQFLETKEGRSQFLKNFQDSFKEFWGQILREMQQQRQQQQQQQQQTFLVETTSNMGGHDRSSNNRRSLALIMSQLCFQLSNSVAEQLYRMLSKTLFRAGKRNRSGSFLIESYEEPPVISQLQWDCKLVIQSCQEAGHVLLDGFIANTGNDLVWLVMDIQSMVDHVSMPSPPTSVSEAWERVYRELNDIERQVILVYGDEGDRLGNHDLSSESIRRESIFKPAGGGGGGAAGGGDSSHHGGGSGGGSRLSNRNESLASFGSNTMNNSRFENQQRNLLLSNIDKLFSDRVEIFTRCQDLNRTGIMFGIIKILLKAWAEAVRMKTFGKGGFQQVQVDAEFAKIWLWRFATADERLMHSLLEETQQTAYRRCIDPAPLDIKTVESIINPSNR